MKPHACLAALVLLCLMPGLSRAQDATLQFHRDGDKLTVTQNGSASTVPATGDNDFIVPVPGAGTTPPEPVIEPAKVVVKITEKAAQPSPKPTAHEVRMAVKSRQKEEEVQPSSIHYVPQPESLSGGGEILSPSVLPSDEEVPLPAVHLAGAQSITPATDSAPKVDERPHATALDEAERKELNMYRTLLAHPLQLTVSGSNVTVKWNAASGTVAIPPSREIDIKLDRVAQAAQR
jgi:hypothetical protein